MIQEWRSIKGYEGLYEVSNFGLVRSLDREVDGSRNGGVRKIKGVILKPGVKADGYLQVHLSKGNEKGHYYVHRLVIEAFSSNPNGLPQVNHIDEDKTNNHIDNLEWVSSKENINHGERTAKTRKIVEQYTMNGDFVKEYRSLTEASLITGVASSNIGNVCNGKRKSAGNYIWKYKI